MKNVSTIIFDLNGVFITSSKLSDRVHQDFGIDESVFLPALKEIMAQVRKPDANDAASYWEPYLQEWNIPLGKEAFLEYWFSAEKENVEMIKIAEELKEKNVPVFILSNNLRERAEYYSDRFPFLDSLFQKVYYSWQTGFIKPDERAYDLILRENNLKPDECIYFDDSETNIAVAEKIGIKSYLFKDAHDVKEKLSELLKKNYRRKW